MNGLYLDASESRIAIAALQLLERDLAAKLESTALASDPENEPLPQSARELLDSHDAVSALAIKLTTAGDHWLSHHEIDVTKEGLGRYVTLLATSIAHHEVEEDDFLLDAELQRRQSELARTSMLLVRLEHIEHRKH